MKLAKSWIIILIVLVIMSLLLLVGCGPNSSPIQGAPVQEQGMDGKIGAGITLFSDDFSSYLEGSNPGKWTFVNEDNLFTSTAKVLKTDQKVGNVLTYKGSFVKAGNEAWKDYRTTLEFKVSNIYHTGPNLMFRISNGNTHYYVIETKMLPKTAPTYIFYKVDNQAKKEISRRSSNIVIDDDKWHTFILNVQGNTFSLNLDGKAIMQAQDFGFDSGGFGLSTNEKSSIYVDNIEVVSL